MENQVVPHETHLDGHQSSPPNSITRNWRHLFSSPWKDTNYRRFAMANLVQAVYRLELDRQENRTQENALAPSWWIPFKYKLTKILIDERDGSIFGAIFEWDRSAALADSLLPIRPRGAPKAVIALRGTLLKSPTRRRDIEDDLRFAAWECLKGSVRFKVTLEALKSVSDTYGSRNACIAGHSLGAGFGLQVGKELAKEGINVETHLFNPPSVSLAMSLGNIGEKALYVWNGLQFMLSSGSEVQVSNDGDKTYGIGLKRFIHGLSGLMDAAFGEENWVPHLYVNSNDYISCFYSYTDGTEENVTDKENMGPTNGQNAAKLFVGFKENQKFLEAHSLKQWLSSDVELQQGIHDSKLITMRSLNIATPSLVILLLYPHIFSFALNHINIKETTDYIWNILKSMPLSSGKAQVNNHGDSTSGVGLKGWIPQLSGLNNASYWVWKCVHYLYVYKNDGTGEKMVDKENAVPTNGRSATKLSVVTKEKLKFLAAHGLEQWWPSDSELPQMIHNSRRIRRQIGYSYTTIPWEVTHLVKPYSNSLAMSLSNIREKEEFVWKWNSLKSMLPSSNEAHVNKDGKNNSDVRLKSWIPQLYGLKDAGFAVGKWVPYMYTNNSDYISKQLKSLYNASATPFQVSHLFNLRYVLPAMSLRNPGEKAEFVWNRLKSMCPLSSEAQVSNEKTSGTGIKSWIPQLSCLKDVGFGVGKWVLPQLYAHKSNGTSAKMFDKENIGPSQVAEGKPS